MAGDFSGTGENFGLDGWRGIQFSVQYDRKLAAFVLGGHVGEGFGPCGIEAENDLVPVEFVAHRAGVDDALAVHLPAFFHQITLYFGFLAGLEFTDFHQFITDRRHEILGIALHFVHQGGAVRMDQPEMQLGTHAEQVFKLRFFILGSDRRLQGNEAAPGG
ncbi:hypothetical protein SDC9_142988 [bioreactor metagenome]|uniref:Uncharacterized protein n=1 Tax=bioreactor metagenome TaxID=1076179 RepID=A0A645E4V2_9ZZZZ